MALGRPYDQKTVVLLREVLDDAWADLPVQQKSRISKSEVALRILRLATRGERDPAKLRAGALTESPSELAG